MKIKYLSAIGAAAAVAAAEPIWGTVNRCLLTLGRQICRQLLTMGWLAE
jgi:hypothetical protein